MFRTFTRIAAGLILLAVLGFAASGNNNRTHAGPFIPELTFSPQVNVNLTTFVAGANPDLQVGLTIPAGDANFSAVIAFVPDASGLGACPPNNPGAFARGCADGSIPDGAMVARVVADSTLGLINGSCTTLIQNIVFNMMDATTDMTNQVIFEDNDGNDVGEQFEIGPDGLPLGVTNYPAYLTRLIHGPGPFGTPDSAPLQPILRTYGQTVIAATDVSLQFLTFQPGITINGLPLDPADGFPIVVVLQNTGDPGAIPEPGNITDSCSPLQSLSTTFGITQDNPNTAINEAGRTYITNPAAGVYDVNLLAFSNRDQDNDGIENQLDPCSTQGNADNWHPADPTNQGDDDADGLPNVCDPAPQTANDDQDGDQYLNRGDNCPLIANGIANAENQVDLDRDGIGDVCDPEPLVPTAIIVPFPLTFPDTKIGEATIVNGLQGDNDCDGDTDTVDSLFSLRLVAGLGRAPCVNVAGDVNCDGALDTIDALQIQRHVAQLQVFQQKGCTELGEVLS